MPNFIFWNAEKQLHHVKELVKRFDSSRPLYGWEGMLGNQDKMVEESKVCMKIQSYLIFGN